MAQPELVRNCQERVRRNNSFEKEKWLQAISVKEVTNPHLKEMILNYFISEGYESAAENFAQESGLNLGERNIEIIKTKDRIRSSLQNRDIESVIEKLDKLNPDILKNNVELKLSLELVNYCKLIQNGDYDSALEFMRQNMTGYMQDQKYSKLIEEHLLLLATKEPSKSPSSDLLSDSRLLDLNTKINKELNNRMDAELIVMMKLLKWMEKRLNTKNSKVPKLMNLSKLKFNLL